MSEIRKKKKNWNVQKIIQRHFVQSLYFKCYSIDQTNRSLPFLDTVNTRQENGYIEVSVYRKSTHTDINISILSPLILYTTAQALSRPNPFQLYSKYSLFRRKTIRRNSTYFLCLVWQWVSQTISKKLFKPKSAVPHRSKRRNHR